MGGRTGTHETLWTWQQHEEAVLGPMADCGPGSSMRRQYRGPWQIRGLAAAMGGRNLPAPYDKKMEHTSSVRRPESGTWHETLWTWQQHEEAGQGPMAD
ncbi:unnamed protein product [Staurois parvus]|uniref:Uncharacterized protein n=1 Tax=Staurois parvus TaxID=386267 RepID=A0ABN9E5J7_9NEOB|nr:unnamed protein product [Staurois parvus]